MQTREEQKNTRCHPLEGIKILDLSNQIPGPYCSMLLADLGAEVIKIENNDGGDQTRLLPYLFNGVNRNKKSISLNLKSSDAKEIFYRLAQKKDMPPSLPGIHTSEILNSLGYTEEEISRLIREKIVG